MKPAPVDLFDHIEEVSTIRCDKCFGMDKTDNDASIASDEFFEKGWRLVKNEVVCPDCNSK